MNPKELAYIKRYQREFKALFGKTLEIDFPSMSGIYSDREMDTVDEWFQECLNKYGLTKKEILRRERGAGVDKGGEHYRFLIEFSKHIISKGLNRGRASLLIGRDRSLIYHYAKK